MPGSSFFLSSPSPSADHPPDESSDRAGPAVPPGRPSPDGQLGSRAVALLARLPISPGRLLAMGGGLVLVAIAALWLLRPPPAAVESGLPRATPSSGPSQSEAAVPTSAPKRTRVVVAVAGLVRHPGLYRLAAGARVDDLIRVAGGMRPGADAERTNLAAPLADGQQLYVPRIGQVDTPAPLEPNGGTGGAGGEGTPSVPGAPGPGGGVGGLSGPIDLNTATADELDTLPGVGPATAESILAYRTEHGSFRSVDELLEVRGIGDAKLAALRAKVRV